MSTDEVVISLHATRRIRQRMKTPEKVARRMADRALARGLTVDTAGQRMSSFLRRMSTHPSGRDRILRAWKGWLFVYSADLVLVTVYRLPEGIE